MNESQIEQMQGQAKTNTIRFDGCKHLIYDRDKIVKQCRLRSLPGGVGAYWERDESLLPDKSCAKFVQFCDLRGRMDGRVTCIKGMAECSEYINHTHEVEIEEEE